MPIRGICIKLGHTLEKACRLAIPQLTFEDQHLNGELIASRVYAEKATPRRVCVVNIRDSPYIWLVKSPITLQHVQ